MAFAITDTAARSAIQAARANVGDQGTWADVYGATYVAVNAATFNRKTFKSSAPRRSA